MKTLPAAGVSTPAVVTLSQLIAFLSYQTRLVAGLVAMKAAEGLEAGAGAADATSVINPGNTEPGAADLLDPPVAMEQRRRFAGAAISRGDPRARYGGRRRARTCRRS